MTKRIRRMTFGVSILCGIVVLISLGFRSWAAFREREEPSASVPSGTFVDVDGLSLHNAETGGGPVIVFIHGAMAWTDTWSPLMDRVADEGFRAIAVDLPPFGFSERPEDHDYSRVAQAERIRRFLEVMDLDSVVLVGHSFGGGATIEAAMLETDRIVGLALLDVAVGLSSDDAGSEPPFAWLFSLEAIRNAVMAMTFTNPWMTGMGLRQFVADDSIVNPARLAVYQRPLVVKGTTVAIGHWFIRGLYGDRSPAISNQVDSYKGYPHPVLLIWGHEDQVTPLSEGEYIHDQFLDSKLQVIDGVNHIPHLEDLEETATHTISFLHRIKRLDEP